MSLEKHALMVLWPQERVKKMLEKLLEMHELDLGEQSSTHLTFLVLMEVLLLNVFVQVELCSSGLAPSFLALDHQEHHLDIPQCLHP